MNASTDSLADETISFGDYGMTGGEIASMAVADSIIRLDSRRDRGDSHSMKSLSTSGLLEYPQYTEPFDFNGRFVPDILYSSNHEAIK
ncbi:MAG: hypothetical protein MZV49_05305 [Rhodopseudomonas palustris]|nr:hypothetical protein [Rhodopseudomonas palustris]